MLIQQKYSGYFGEIVSEIQLCLFKDSSSIHQGLISELHLLFHQLYNQQHGEYPAANGDGTDVANTEAAFLSQLTTFTDDAGDSNATKTATHIYGPYLTRSTMPADPFKNVAVVEVGNAGSLPLVATAGDPGGWKFDNLAGQIILNHSSYASR